VSESREHQPAGRRTYRIAGLRDRAGASSLASLGHVDDLVAAYALGALEADELAAVDAHVRACPACEKALIDAQRTAGMLSFVVPFKTPPADSKAALFARVAQTRKAAAASSLPTSNFEAFRTPTLPRSTAEDLVLPTRSAAVVAPEAERQARSGWLVSVVSVPLLIALIATGFWGFQLRNQLASQNTQLAELQAELTNFGSGTTSYPLSPGTAAPQAEGQIVMGADQRAGMLQIDVNSKEGPSAYELWVNQDGELRPVSEVTVNQDGQGQARFELDQPFSEYESVHIRAKAVDASVAPSPNDTLFQDNGGALGSTGSGLDVGP
jgi:anti-sigma factor RsiW